MLHMVTMLLRGFRLARPILLWAQTHWLATQLAAATLHWVRLPDPISMAITISILATLGSRKSQMSFASARPTLTRTHTSPVSVGQRSLEVSESSSIAKVTWVQSFHQNDSRT